MSYKLPLLSNIVVCNGDHLEQVYLSPATRKTHRFLCTMLILVFLIVTKSYEKSKTKNVLVSLSKLCDSVCLSNPGLSLEQATTSWKVKPMRKCTERQNKVTSGPKKLRWRRPIRQTQKGSIWRLEKVKL